MSEAKHRILRKHNAPAGGTFLLRLARDKAGNVLPLVAAGTLVLTGLVGGGVDMARSYQAERRLQAACDAGALAGRRAVANNGFDDAAEAQAHQYFDTNYDGAKLGTSNEQFVPVSNDNGNTVDGTATATLPTVIMRVFGYDTLGLSVSCSASMGIGNSDIMFVLDNTGSMMWTPAGDNTSTYEETRMFALEQAMMAFYDTVAAANAGTNARIRYGFVPYSSAVNVGALLNEVDTSFVADRMTVQSRQPVNWGPIVDTWTETGTPTPTQTGDFSRLETKYSSEADCNAVKPADATTWSEYDTDSAGESNTFDPVREQRVHAVGTHHDYRKADYDCRYREGSWSTRGWYVYLRYYYRTITSYNYDARNPEPVTTANTPFADWLYRPVEFDVSTYKTFAAASALVSSSSGRATFNTATVWPGCIQERDTTPATSFSFVDLLTGITPGEALDLDIDGAPTGDAATQWKPLWGSVTFRRWTTEPSLSGSNAPATGTTWQSGDTYCPSPSQLLTEMDEDAFDQYVEDLAPEGSTYHDIGLIWGARLSSPTGIFADNVNAVPGNGGTVSRHVILMTDGELAPSLSVNSSYGLESIDRRITTDGSSATQSANHRSRYLAVCAAIRARGIRLWVVAFGADVALSADLVTCASPDSAFRAVDAAALNSTFQEIANQVGELRIVQ